MEGFGCSYFFIPLGVFFHKNGKVFRLLLINLVGVKLFLKLRMHIVQDLLSTTFPCLFIITHKVSLFFFDLVLDPWSQFFLHFFSSYLPACILFTFEKQVLLEYQLSECHLALSHFL